MLCPDIFSTGLSGAESGNIRVGDAVAVFAQGPIGLCATLGAKLKGASLIIGVDSNAGRLDVARQLRRQRHAQHPTTAIRVAEIKRLTDGRGVDVAIEALGRQETFENALRAMRPGGTLSSLGVYSGKLVAPYEAFYAGLGDQKIVTTLCPGRQGADAAADGDGRAPARRSDAARHAPVSRSTTSRRRSTCSATSATAC